MEDKKYTCSDTPKLYSCPFCGSENITIRYGASGYTSNVHYPNETGFVACLKCGARSLKTRYAKNAVKKWNVRKESNAAAPKWISVDDPPKNMRKVFAYLRDGTMAVTYYNPLSETWYFKHNYKITHWMPLPEPPKEDA